MRGFSRSLQRLTIGLALFAGPGAHAADPPAAPPPAAAAPATESTPADVTPAVAAEVTEHVAQGHRLYLLGRYQEAIGEYRRAYELRADPQFLLDTAEAYRQLGATKQALFYYDRYLAAAPNSPNREIVEDRVTELELLRAPPLVPPVATPPPVKARPAPVWKRWWLWTAVGAAVGAGITAVALSGRSTSPAVPASDLGNQRFFP